MGQTFAVEEGHYDDGGDGGDDDDGGCGDCESYGRDCWRRMKDGNCRGESKCRKEDWRR